MKKLLVVGIIVLVLVFSFVFKDKIFKVAGKPIEPEISNEVTEDKLEIISTNPDPLEGAVILPSQSIEIKFNKIISVSEFKHKFDPEVEHEVKVISDNTEESTIIKISFKKPLELGNGYTLFVLANTISEDNKLLNRDFVYHFSTIKYRGV